ncbi:MAG: hypothetical protein JSU61_13780 [Fidelibacterota bacterium]|nr:MAG: hypothetical protein JSU61_13780 [Candidatus Neomarinimicrobiota bacterium]
MLKTLSPYAIAFLLIAAVVHYAYPPLSAQLTAEARPSKLTLFNNTPHTLWYAAFEQSTARNVGWKPCDHPDLCPSEGIEPGRSRDIPYTHIYHWYPGARVTVFWWRLAIDSTAENGYRVDGMEHLIVATPQKPLLGS